MKFKPFLLAPFVLVVAGALAFAKISQAAPPIVMGYFPSYREAPTVSQIRFDRFTHVIHSFVTADANGKVKIPAEISASTLVDEAHAHGAKVLLALGGGSGSVEFGKMVRQPAQRAQFIKDIVQLMSDSKWDGLALDWEQPEASDKTITVEFVTNLRAAMKAAQPDSLLVLVVNSSPGNSHGYDGPKLHGLVDFLHVMAYDFHGEWNHAGHHTSLFEDTSDPDGKPFSYPAALAFWRDVQGFPNEKILFGITGYGRGFKVKEWGEKPTQESEYPLITFNDARALIGKGWTRQWDAETHAPWLLKDDKSDRISYEDEQSVADKAAWMKSQGLPGFFIWEIGQEYADGDFTLTAAAQKSWAKAPKNGK